MHLYCGNENPNQNCRETSSQGFGFSEMFVGRTTLYGWAQRAIHLSSKNYLTIMINDQEANYGVHKALEFSDEEVYESMIGKTIKNRYGLLIKTGDTSVKGLYCVGIPPENQHGIYARFA